MKPTELQEHPEGGRFKEVYRSYTEVQKGNVKRNTLTHIYFSLEADEISHFHKVTSDEVWNLYEGAGFYLYLWDEDFDTIQKIEVSREANCYCHVVPAGIWQATEPIRDRILVGCSVAPGFDFKDFSMLSTDNHLAAKLLQISPEMKKFIQS